MEQGKWDKQEEKMDPLRIEIVLYCDDHSHLSYLASHLFIKSKVTLSF